MEDNEKDAMSKFIAQKENTETQSQEVQHTEPKPTSLGKVRNREFEGREDAHQALASKYGWQRISMDNLPTRRNGLDFYPEGMSVMIKAADTPQVRHWSEIDEEDAFSIDSAFNDMLISCCKVSYETQQIGAYKDLLEEDRIYLLLEIRALTYPEPEQNLVFEHKCDECDTKNELKLENNYFKSVDINPIIMKYYNSESKDIVIKTKTYGEIILTPPTIGIMQAVSKYIKDLRDAGDKIDKTFIKILPYIAGSWRGLNAKKIKEISVMYYSWDETKFSLMLDMCEKSRCGVDSKMYTTCKDCSSEVAAPITFPGGVKAVFVISDFSSELL